MEEETRTDEEEDMREEIKVLRELLAAEIRKEARHRNTSSMKEWSDRALTLHRRIKRLGPRCTVNKTKDVYSKSSKKKVRSAVENLYATDPNDLIPGRNRDGAIFTYLGASHYVLNLSVKQAFAKLGEDDTAEALVAELLQMGDKGVWATKSREEMKELYRLGRVKNVLPCSIFLKEKFDADKRYLKLKARLVAHGNRQIMDQIFGAKDVDSPTVSLAVVNMLIQMAAAGNWAKRVVDVAGAYLNADLKTPEYMRIPKNVVDLIEAQLRKGGSDVDSLKQDDGSVIVELKKALYGLRQAGREWYELLAGFLTKDCGYVRSEIDKCLFTRVEGDIICHLAVYVDDILIISNSMQEIERVTSALEEDSRRLQSKKVPICHS
jgi:hypothetical protein